MKLETIRALLSAVVFVLCAPTAFSTTSGTSSITAISVQNTNLLLSARIPPDSVRVALEGRVALNEPWQELRSLDVADTAESVSFTIPRPEKMHFFRVKATPRATNVAAMISPEFGYVAISPLGPEGSGSDAVLHFKG